jgi:tetratricopeptide (TPR) repeat protein
MNRLKLEDVISQAKEVLEAGNPDYVIALCRYIFRYYPRALEATRVLGEAYTEKKLLDEADQLFVYVLAADPHDVLGYVDRGFIAYERGKVDEAIMYYERAIELDPNIEQLRAELLRLYKERYGSSRTKLRLTKAGLANHRMRDGFYSQAIEEYNNILSETPDRLDIQTWLMEAYWCNRDYVRAEKLAHELLESYPYLIKSNLVLWHIYGVRRRQDKAGEYLEKAHALDPLNIIAERLFDNAQLMPEVRQYLDMMGTATLPAFDPTTVESETADQPLLPVWVTADAETDRRLGLRGEEAAATAATLGEDLTQESDWLSKLLAETEQMVEGQPAATSTAETISEEANPELALEQFRQGSADDEVFGLFEEIEEQQGKIDLEETRATKKAGDELDLNFDELAARPGEAGEVAPFKAEDQLDSLFEELAPQNNNLPLEPARFDQTEPADQTEFKPGAFDFDLEPFDAAVPEAKPERFQFNQESQSAPFGLEGDTKTNRLQGFDLGFDEEVTSPGNSSFAFDEEPAPFNLNSPPAEIAPSANFSETDMELFDFGRTEATSIRPDKWAPFGEKETTPPPPFKLEELDFAEPEPPIAPVPVLHDDSKAKEEAPPPPFSLDEFNLDEPQFKFEALDQGGDGKSVDVTPVEVQETREFRAGRGLTGELNDFFDDPEPFGVDLFAPTVPPQQLETNKAPEATAQHLVEQGGAGEPKTSFRDAATESLEATQETEETETAATAPGTGLEPFSGWQEEAKPESAVEVPEEANLPAEIVPLSFETEEAPTQAEGAVFEPALESLDDASFINFLLEEEKPQGEPEAVESFEPNLGKNNEPATFEANPVEPPEPVQVVLEDEVILPGYEEEPVEVASQHEEIGVAEAAAEAEPEEVRLTYSQSEPTEAGVAIEPETILPVEETGYTTAPFEVGTEAETLVPSLAQESSFESVSAQQVETEMPEIEAAEAVEFANLSQSAKQTPEEFSFAQSEPEELGEAITTPANQAEPEEALEPAVVAPLAEVRTEEATEPEIFEAAAIASPEDIKAQPHAFHQRDERGARKEAEAPQYTEPHAFHQRDERGARLEPQLEAAQYIEPHAFHQRDERGVLAGKTGTETGEEAGLAGKTGVEVGEVQPEEFHAFHRRDERGPVPEALVRNLTGQIEGEDALADGAAIQARTDFNAFETAANAEVSRTNAPEVESTPVPGIESSDKENGAMPIKRGGKDDDNNVFDWEREELPDYLRDFALDEDEVARAPRPTNPPISSEADMTTGPTRIRSREPEAPSPNELPDWLNPAANRQPPQMNLPGTDQIKLGGGRPGAGGGGSLPGWLDATEEGSKPSLGRGTGPTPGPMDGIDDLKPFSFDDGDGFGGPSLQPPAIPGTPAPRAQAPQPPRPAQNQPPAPAFGMDDMDIQPFSLDSVDNAGFAPPPPMQRQSPPGPPPPRQQPPQAQPQSFTPPPQPFSLGGEDDIQPFSLDGMDGGFAPPPPSPRPPTPQPPQQRPAPTPQPPVQPFNLGGEDDLDIQPFSLDGMDGGFAPPPPTPSRPAQTPPPAARPTPPQQPVQPFGLDDMDIQPFNPLNFNDAPTVPTPTPPPSRQQPPTPPAPQFPQANPNMPFGMPGGFDDDLGDLQPFSLDDGAGVPTPPPAARPAPTPPPAARPTPPQQPAAQPFNFGGGFDDDLPAPFNPFEITGETPPTTAAPSQPAPFNPAQPASFNPTPMGGEGFVQATPGSLFGNKNTPPPASPSRGNQPNAGNMFPTDIDDVDLQPFNVGMDIPGLGGNEPASFRANLDDMPSNPLYRSPKPRSRQPEPEFEVEPGQEKPLQNFGWLKNRRKQDDDEEENRGGSLFKKLADKRKQQGPLPDTSPSMPLDLGPVEPDPFADYVSFEEIERQAAQPATPPPPTPIERPTFQPFSFELDQTPARPQEPEVQPFSFELDNAATPAQPPAPEVQPFSFEFNSASATPAPQEPEVQPFSFDLGSPAKPQEPEVQPFSFDLDNPPAPTSQPETVQPFNFDLGSVAPPSQPAEPEVQPFSFEFEATPATPPPPPEPPVQPFNFDLGQAQEPEVQPFSFDLGPAEAAPLAHHPSEPAIPEFKLEQAEEPAPPPPPPPPPPSNFFGVEDDLTEFDAPQRKPQIEPFGFDLSELAAVPPPPPPPTPTRSLSEIQVPPPPPLPVQEPKGSAETVPPPAFQPETPRPALAVNGNGAGNDLANYQSRIRQNPKDLEANLQLGNAYVEQNKVTEALAHYSNAIKVADAETLKTIVAKLQKITEESDANPRYHRVLGDAYMKQGQYHWALSEYSKALGTTAKR